MDDIEGILTCGIPYDTTSIDEDRLRFKAGGYCEVLCIGCLMRIACRSHAERTGGACGAFA